MKKIAIIILIFLVTACAANPVQIKVVEEYDNYLNCYQIYQEIQKAEYYKKESRKEDRFRMRYMMPINAMMSIWNINKAESLAIKRIEHLQNLAMQRRCR